MILTLPWLGQKMVGLENYTDLWTDPVAWQALQTTLIFVAVTVPSELLLGLGMALVMNEAFRGRGLLRAIVLVPWAIPTVVSSQMWRFIFNDRYGLFNFVLFGGDTARYFAPLADPRFRHDCDHGRGNLENCPVCGLDYSGRIANHCRRTLRSREHRRRHILAEISQRYLAAAMAGAIVGIAFSHDRRPARLRPGLCHDAGRSRRCYQRAAVLRL